MPTHPQPLSAGFPNTGSASVPMESEQPQPARWGRQEPERSGPTTEEFTELDSNARPKGRSGLWRPQRGARASQPAQVQSPSVSLHPPMHQGTSKKARNTGVRKICVERRLKTYKLGNPGK